eukprot:10630680-Alexandrium_andersonii.AAC.1
MSKERRSGVPLTLLCTREATSAPRSSGLQRCAVEDHAHGLRLRGRALVDDGQLCPRPRDRGSRTEIHGTVLHDQERVPRTV